MAEKSGLPGKIRFEVGKTDDRPETLRTAGADDRGIIEKVDEVIVTAVHHEASDVHFEPSASGTVVRARVNGALTPLQHFPSELHPKVVNRIKILSAMDITRSRIPQRGYFKVIIEDRKIEIYANAFPSVAGEKIVLKIHYRKALTLALDHLGMFPTMLQPFREACLRQHGLILIVGPPGSGKTSTSYAILQLLHSVEKEMMSIEHVLKFEIPGMVQGRPDDLADFSFAMGVRAMMDQGPDIALVGEVNEPEVARAIVQGAFAKRIVVARMTSNDTISAISTLVDMGVQPFLVTAALNTVLSQRLVRKICAECRESYTPPPELLDELGYRLPANTLFHRGRGCEACDQTGMTGILGIFELFLPGEEVNDLIIARKPASTVREAALKGGMTPLKKDGVQKVIKGYTSVEEVLNAL